MGGFESFGDKQPVAPKGETQSNKEVREPTRYEVELEAKRNRLALQTKIIFEKNPGLEHQVQKVNAVQNFLPSSDQPLMWSRLSMPRSPTDGMFFRLPPSLYVRYDDASEKWQFQWVKDMADKPANVGWKPVVAQEVPTRWTAGASDVKMMTLLSALNSERK